MPTSTKKSKKMIIPKEMLGLILETHRQWEKFIDQFEDFTVLSDTKSLKEIRKARQEHLLGKTKSLKEITRQVNV